MVDIKYPLASDTIDRQDIDALCNWMQQDPIPRLTMGDLTLEFQKKWAEYIGTKYSLAVNWLPWSEL